MDMKAIGNYCRKKMPGITIKTCPAHKGIRIDFTIVDEKSLLRLTVSKYIRKDSKDLKEIIKHLKSGNGMKKYLNDIMEDLSYDFQAEKSRRQNRTA